MVTSNSENPVYILLNTPTQSGLTDFLRRSSRHRCTREMKWFQTALLEAAQCVGWLDQDDVIVVALETVGPTKTDQQLRDAAKTVAKGFRTLR